MSESEKTRHIVLFERFFKKMYYFYNKYENKKKIEEDKLDKTDVINFAESITKGYENPKNTWKNRSLISIYMLLVDELDFVTDFIDRKESAKRENKPPYFIHYKKYLSDKSGLNLLAKIRVRMEEENKITEKMTMFAATYINNSAIKFREKLVDTIKNLNNIIINIIFNNKETEDINNILLSIRDNMTDRSYLSGEILLNKYVELKNKDICDPTDIDHNDSPNITTIKTIYFNNLDNLKKDLTSLDKFYKDAYDKIMAELFYLYFLACSYKRYEKIKIEHNGKLKENTAKFKLFSEKLENNIASKIKINDISLKPETVRSIIEKIHLFFLISTINLITDNTVQSYTISRTNVGLTQPSNIIGLYKMLIKGRFKRYKELCKKISDILKVSGKDESYSQIINKPYYSKQQEALSKTNFKDVLVDMNRVEDNSIRKFVDFMNGLGEYNGLLDLDPDKDSVTINSKFEWLVNVKKALKDKESAENYNTIFKSENEGSDFADALVSLYEELIGAVRLYVRSRDPATYETGFGIKRDQSSQYNHKITIYNGKESYTYSPFFYVSEKGEGNISFNNRFNSENLIKLLTTVKDQNITILTYGYSGSGKTRTLFGDAGEPGIIKHMIEMITPKNIDNITIKKVYGYLDRIGSSGDSNFTFKEHEVESIEVYRNNQTNQSKPQTNSQRAMSAITKTIEEITKNKHTPQGDKMVIEGGEDEFIKSTPNNINSSRGFLMVECLVKNGNKLTFVDMAGSEDPYQLQCLLLPSYNIPSANNKNYINSTNIIEKDIVVSKFVSELRKAIETCIEKTMERLATISERELWGDTLKYVTDPKTNKTIKNPKFIEADLQLGKMLDSIVYVPFKGDLDKICDDKNKNEQDIKKAFTNVNKYFKIFSAALFGLIFLKMRIGATDVGGEMKKYVNNRVTEDDFSGSSFPLYEIAKNFDKTKINYLYKNFIIDIGKHPNFIEVKPNYKDNNKFDINNLDYKNNDPFNHVLSFNKDSAQAQLGDIFIAFACYDALISNDVCKKSSYEEVQKEINQKYIELSNTREDPIKYETLLKDLEKLISQKMYFTIKNNGVEDLFSFKELPDFNFGTVEQYVKATSMQIFVDYSKPFVEVPKGGAIKSIPPPPTTPVRFVLNKKTLQYEDNDKKRKAYVRNNNLYISYSSENQSKTYVTFINISSINGWDAQNMPGTFVISTIDFNANTSFKIVEINETKTETQYKMYTKQGYYRDKVPNSDDVAYKQIKIIATNGTNAGAFCEEIKRPIVFKPNYDNLAKIFGKMYVNVDIKDSNGATIHVKGSTQYFERIINESFYINQVNNQLISFLKKEENKKEGCEISQSELLFNKYDKLKEIPCSPTKFIKELKNINGDSITKYILVSNIRTDNDPLYRRGVMDTLELTKPLQEKS